MTTYVNRKSATSKEKCMRDSIYNILPDARSIGRINIDYE